MYVKCTSMFYSYKLNGVLIKDKTGNKRKVDFHIAYLIDCSFNMVTNTHS